jgi:hypothetical protein
MTRIFIKYILDTHLVFEVGACLMKKSGVVDATAVAFVEL